jgi:hypothetical protein
MYFKEIGCDYVNWIGLARDILQCRALVNTNEPSGSV